MRNNEIEIKDTDSLLDAELKEFYNVLVSGKSLDKDHLEYLDNRYDRFDALKRTLPLEKSRLCDALIKDATVQLVRGASNLVEKYKGHRVSNGDREYFLDIFMLLTKVLEGDLPKEIKDSAEAVSEDIAEIGGL